jgi:hypothetical protein
MGYQRPRGFSSAFNVSSTLPGSTAAMPASLSISSVRVRYLLSSMTSASPTVWPHCEVPAPRGSTGTPCSTAICIAAMAASILRGITTPTGVTW